MQYNIMTTKCHRVMLITVIVHSWFPLIFGWPGSIWFDFCLLQFIKVTILDIKPLQFSSLMSYPYQKQCGLFFFFTWKLEYLSNPVFPGYLLIMIWLPAHDTQVTNSLCSTLYSKYSSHPLIIILQSWWSDLV